MLVLRKKSLILAGLVAAAVAHAAEYYVAANGSDSNAGSSASPWAHCPSMNGWSGSASLQPGDVVYFKNSDTWTNPSGDYVLRMTGGVTYDGSSWGSGTRAVLRASGSAYLVVKWINDDDAYETVLSGFELNGGDMATGVGMGSPSAPYDLVGATKRVIDCVVHDCGYANESGTSYGIKIGMQDGRAMQNVEVIDCVVYNIARSGIANYHSLYNSASYSENVLIRGNEVYNTGEKSTSGGYGILVKNRAVDTVVEFNYVHDTSAGIGLTGGGSALSGPIDCIVRYNIVSGTDDEGIIIRNSYEKSFDIYGNLVMHSGLYGMKIESTQSGDLTGGIYNNIFFENCVSSGSSEVLFQNPSSGAVAVDFRNNIISARSGDQALVNYMGSGLTHGYNLYYRPDGGTLVTSGSSYSSSTLTGWESTAVAAQPGFVNTDNLPEGFSGTYGVDMQPESTGLIPTQNVEGMGQTLTTEFAGSIDLSGTSSDSLRSSPWDIGAYAMSAEAYEPDVDDPTTPTGLVATAVSTSQIDLVWEASSDDTGVSGYRVYRDGTEVATTTVTGYSDTGLSDSERCTYAVLAYDAAGNESDLSQAASATTLALDVTAMTSTSEWQNRSFDAQSGIFEVEYDVVASGNSIDACTGLSLGDAASYYEMAVTTRFYTSGQFDARNGPEYTSDVQMSYTAGVTYHFRMIVDVPDHTYSVYVTEDGGDEILIAEDFAFRTGLENVESLDTWTVVAQSGSHEVRNFSVTPVDATAGAVVPVPPSYLRVIM